MNNASPTVLNSTEQHQHQPEHQNEPIVMDSEITFPDSWDLTAGRQGSEEFAAIRLEEESEEFQQLSELFHISPLDGPDGKRLPDIGGTITGIMRIQNKRLWAQYYRRKQKMQQAKGGTFLGIRNLFHGTAPENVDSICRRGFEVDRPSVHGRALGKGIYFAEYSGLAHRFTYPRSATPCKPVAISSSSDGDKADLARQSNGPGPSTAMSQDEDNHFRRYIFLCLVLVGDALSIPSVPVSTGGSQPVHIQRRPPTPRRRFDSYRAGTKLLQQYVVFNNNQAYPEYVIEYYTKCAHTASDTGSIPVASDIGSVRVTSGARSIHMGSGAEAFRLLLAARSIYTALATGSIRVASYTGSIPVASYTGSNNMASGTGSFHTASATGSIPVLSGAWSNNMASGTGSIPVVSDTGSIRVTSRAGPIRVTSGARSIRVASRARPIHVTSGTGSIRLLSGIRFIHTGSIPVVSDTGSLHEASATGSLHEASATGSIHEASGTGSIHEVSGTGSIHEASGTGSIPEASGTGSIPEASGTGSIPVASDTGSIRVTSGVYH